MRLRKEGRPQKSARRWSPPRLKHWLTEGARGRDDHALRTPQLDRDPRRNRGCEAAAGAAIRILDSWLQRRPFVGGAAFSMADIPAGTLMFRYFEIEIERPPAPAVAACRARPAQRAPYREPVMRPFGELFGRLAF
jgi:glutathione S-transferase